MIFLSSHNSGLVLLETTQKIVQHREDKALSLTLSVIHEHDAEHLGSITFTIAPTAEVFSSAFLEDPGVVLLFPSMAFAHLG